MISTKRKIEDTKVKNAIDDLQKIAEDGKNGNFELRGDVTKKDIAGLVEGKRYVDTKNKRIVFKIGTKAYYQNLTELT